MSDAADPAGDIGASETAATAEAGGEPLLRVEDLVKHYPLTRGLLRREIGRVRAVDGISFELDRGESLGLVGETGSGKSTAARTLLHLEEPTSGAVWFDGDRVDQFDRAARKRFRRRAQMVFQDTDASFNPRQTVGEAVAEPLELHGMDDTQRRRAIVEDLLGRVGLEGEQFERYPHELSGGQLQRVALARALVLNPDLLVADEPASALDASVKAAILSLMADLQADFDLSILLITHDMGVVRSFCDRVAVMYLGEIVEIGPTDQVFSSPQHPYTRALVASIPSPDPHDRGGGVSLSGDLPDPADPPSGCRFHTRCPVVVPPEEWTGDQEAYRAVMDLRAALAQDAVDPEDIQRIQAVAGEGPDERMSVAAAIRAEYDIPETFADSDAESAVAAAIDSIEADDQARALEALAGLESPCEDIHPELVETAAGQPAACIRHDPELPGLPPDER